MKPASAPLSFATTSPAKKIRRAISSLLATNPYFGVLSLRLKVQPSRQVKNIAGDGITLTYNPGWVQEASHDMVKGCIAHIVYACALKHHVRRGDRDYNRWNRASRIATAGLLKDEDIWTPGVDIGMDLPIEVIYDKLPEDDDDSNDQQPSPQGMPTAGPGAGGQGQGQGQNPGQGQGQSKGQGQSQNQGSGQQLGKGPGEVQDAPEDQREEQDQKWDQAGKQAIQTAKSIGSDPGNIEQKFKNQHVHRRDWQDILLEYMRSAAPSDYSWARPNRRHIDEGLYLPSLHGLGMGPIVIAIDTSGSVDDIHVNQALTEMFAIAQDVNPERIHLLQCDTRITDETDFDASDPPTEVKIRGRGGTDFRPVFEHVEKKGINPEVLIYMTDMEVYNWPSDPGYPVIWAVENEDQAKQAPFGQSIVIDVKPPPEEETAA